MKTIQLKAPRGLKDYRLKHASRLMSLSNMEDKTFSFSNILQHVSAYTDTPVEELRFADPKQINTIFNNCITALNKYKKKEPLKEIEVNGKKYVLIDIFKQKAGWLIDVEATQEHFQTQPEKMCALCYIEKGKEYGDVPNKDREDVFREHFPAYLFFDLNAFFLDLWLNYTTVSTLVKNQRMKAQMKMMKRKERIKKILGIQRKR